MTQEEIIFEQLDNSHLAELVMISRDTFSGTFGNQNTPENIQLHLDNSFNEERLSGELADTNCEFYFAKNQDQIIGYLKINFNDAQTDLKEKEGMELERIYVLKEFQGRGFGNSMINFVIAKARETHIKYVWLGVWERNVKAVEFYKRQQFEIFDTHSFMLGEEEQVDYIMRLEMIDV